MSGESVVVVVGSESGPLTLLDDALGRRLLDQLRRHGVAWLATSGHRRSGRDLAAAARDERAVTRAVAGRCRTLLVTAEAGDGLVELLAEVAVLVPEPSLAVRLVVERQDRVAEHAIMAGLRAGKPTDDPGDVDHATTVRTLAALPFVGSVTPRPYELVHGGVVTWVDDLLDVVGLRGRLDLRPLAEGDGPPSPYRGYSSRGLRIGRVLLPELTTAGQRELLHDFLMQTCPADDDRLLPEAERTALVAGHRDANRAFFAEYLPDLPPDSYGDDDATALLAQVPVSVRLRGTSPRVRVRRSAGRARRAVKRSVRRAAQRRGAGS